MAAVTPFERAAMLDRLRTTERFDVIVIGGGITGVGVALDAASRGLSTALVERHDFASGTSSKSSKLVHGGLRYLQQGDIRLVYEALRERYRLRRNAPHLVEILPFMIPILSRDSVVSRKIARAMGTAMWMYDLTGGFRIGKFHQRLSADEAFEHMPTTRRDRLTSAYMYYDATADDARLTLSIARTAAEHGAVMVNRCAVVGVDTTAAGGGATGVRVHDSVTGDELELRAAVVVNAAGVWSDEVRELHADVGDGSLRPAKGVHVTVPWDRVRNDVAVVIPVPGDKRSLFVVPWGRRDDGSYLHCYIGTTDTDYDGPLDEPQCTADDIAYVLAALNAALDPELEPITADDITATWAGLRPLVAAASSQRTADLSRRHVVTDGEDGVVRVTGGKLTTYREMAEDAVDVVVRRLEPSRRSRWSRRSRTKKLALTGAAKPPAPGSVDEVEAHLAHRYGTHAADVRALVDGDASLGEPMVAALPYLRAEAVYAARHEMVTALTDVLTRRTRAHLLDREATREAARDIAELIAPELAWDADEVARQVERYGELCDAEASSNKALGAVTLG